jgi:hypothetical protein
MSLICLVVGHDQTVAIRGDEARRGAIEVADAQLAGSPITIRESDALSDGFLGTGIVRLDRATAKLTAMPTIMIEQVLLGLPIRHRRGSLK